jgi:NTP-dependent ternary system trypsin peptidase co-occuring protein
MTNVVIGLAAAIAALREELLLAIEAGDGADMRFRLAPIELSLQVAVTREGEGKIGWKVLGLGGSYESATTQVLKLQLEPVWLKGDGSYTNDFVIGDQYQQPASFGPRDQAGSLRDWSTRRGLRGRLGTLAWHPG